MPVEPPIQPTTPPPETPAPHAPQPLAPPPEVRPARPDVDVPSPQPDIAQGIVPGQPTA